MGGVLAIPARLAAQMMFARPQAVKPTCVDRCRQAVRKLQQALAPEHRRQHVACIAGDRTHVDGAGWVRPVRGQCSARTCQRARARPPAAPPMPADRAHQQSSAGSRRRATAPCKPRCAPPGAHTHTRTSTHTHTHHSAHPSRQPAGPCRQSGSGGRRRGSAGAAGPPAAAPCGRSAPVRKRRRCAGCWSDERKRST